MKSFFSKVLILWGSTQRPRLPPVKPSVIPCAFLASLMYPVVLTVLVFTLSSYFFLLPYRAVSSLMAEVMCIHLCILI